jgi:Zn-dependent protease/CBS domain-containing protein
MGGGSIQLARLFGIRIGASPSWFVVLFVMVYLLSDYFADALGGSAGQALGVAVLAAALFFVSIVLHELGHARVAQRNGITINGIDLWFFGGVAKLDRDTESPGEEFRISAAGPAVTAVVAGAAAALAIALSSPQEVLDSARFSDAAVSPTIALLSWLATINLFLLVFNLVPAFPLDGGRIARAIAWRLTGDKHRATRIAGRMGQVFAYVMIGAGAYLALTSDPFNGVWFMVLGYFLFQGARGAVLSANFSESIEGVTVADVMDPEPVIVAGGTALGPAREELEQRGWPWTAVVDLEARYIGILHAARDDDVRDEHGRTVADAVDERDRHEFAVDGATPLDVLLDSEPLRRLGALVVVDERSRLIGVVTVEQVHRALAAAAPGR